LLVSPYVLVASLVGYLVAYWFLLPSQWRLDYDQRAKLKLRAALGPLLASPIALLVAVAPFLNADKVDARDARPINAYAEEVLQHAGGREWLVTDGLLDNHLRILAHDMGTDVEFLDLRQGNDEHYMRYIAERVGEPRLKSLAKVGLSVFLQEWLETTPGIEDRLAIFGPSGLWNDVDMKAVPNGPLFFGRESLADLAVDGVLKDTTDFVDRVVPTLREVRESPRVGHLARQLLCYTGLTANNAGVLLQDAGRSADAFAAYALSRRVDESNVSALFNQAAMIERGFESGEADAVRAALKEIKDGGRRYDIWRLSRAYGTVRTPEATAQLGIALALSGRRDAAVRDLTRALAKTREGQDPIIRQTLAAVYLAGGERDKSEKLYREILADDPTNTAVLESMVKLTMQRGAFDEAEKYLAKARECGLSEEAVAVANAALSLLCGDRTAARETLDESILRHPESLRLLTMRAGLADSMGDDILFSQCLNRIRALPNGAGHAAFLAAEAALKTGDIGTARRHLERALSARIADERVLGILLELDLREVRPKLAERHARRLLAINPRHVFASYVLGSVQIDRGDYELAEASLRSSIRHRKTPLALNDLSWLLERKGKYEEAEVLAREAVAMADKVPSFWDTLGVALTRTGKYDEADAALRKAMELGIKTPATALHMAELQILRGNVDDARRFLRKAENAQQGLSVQDREHLGTIRRRLRELASPR